MNGAWGGSTRRGHTVYLHAFPWEGNTLRLTPIRPRIERAEALTGGTIQFRQSSEGVDLELSDHAQHPVVTLIKLTLDKPASEIQTGPALRLPTLGSDLKY